MSQCHDPYEAGGYPEPEEPSTEAVPSCHDDYRPARAGRVAPGPVSGARSSEQAPPAGATVAGRRVMDGRTAG